MRHFRSKRSVSWTRHSGLQRASIWDGTNKPTVQAQSAVCKTNLVVD